MARPSEQVIELHQLPLGGLPLADRDPVSHIVGVLITLRYPETTPEWKVHENERGDAYIIASHWPAKVCFDMTDLDRLRNTNPAMIRRIHFFASPGVGGKSGCSLNLHVEVRKLSCWTPVTCSVRSVRGTVVNAPSGSGVDPAVDQKMVEGLQRMMAGLRLPVAQAQTTVHDDAPNAQWIVSSHWPQLIELDLDHLDVIRHGYDPLLLGRIYFFATDADASNGIQAINLNLVTEIRKATSWSEREPLSLLRINFSAGEKTHEYHQTDQDGQPTITKRGRVE